jgi:hypothetical protein
MNLAGLHAEFIGQVGHGHFIRQVPANNLGPLLHSKLLPHVGHGMFLQSGYANGTGLKFHFRVKQNKAH